MALYHNWWRPSHKECILQIKYRFEALSEFSSLVVDWNTSTGLRQSSSDVICCFLDIGLQLEQWKHSLSSLLLSKPEEDNCLTFVLYVYLSCHMSEPMLFISCVIFFCFTCTYVPILSYFVSRIAWAKGFQIKN